MRHAVLASLAVLKQVGREEITHDLTALNYAQRLRNAFLILIIKAINCIESIGSDAKEQILEAMDHAVDSWLRAAVLMDISGLKRQILADMNCET